MNFLAGFDLHGQSSCRVEGLKIVNQPTYTIDPAVDRLLQKLGGGSKLGTLDYKWQPGRLAAVQDAHDETIAIFGGRTEEWGFPVGPRAILANDELRFDVGHETYVDDIHKCEVQAIQDKLEDWVLRNRPKVVVAVTKSSFVFLLWDSEQLPTDPYSEKGIAIGDYRIHFGSDVRFSWLTKANLAIAQKLLQCSASQCDSDCDCSFDRKK